MIARAHTVQIKRAYKRACYRAVQHGCIAYRNPPAPKLPRRFYKARIIPQVQQVLIALARGGDHFRSRILCFFSRFWSRLKVLEDKFVLMFAILKPLGIQEMQFSALHYLHHLDIWLNRFP